MQLRKDRFRESRCRFRDDNSSERQHHNGGVGSEEDFHILGARLECPRKRGKEISREGDVEVPGGYDAQQGE